MHVQRVAGFELVVARETAISRTLHVSRFNMVAHVGAVRRGERTGAALPAARHFVHHTVQLD